MSLRRKASRSRRQSRPHGLPVRILLGVVEFVCDMTNLLLTLVALAQIAAIYYVAHSEEIPVPKPVLKHIQKQLEKQGVRLAFDGGLYMDFDGGIRAEGLHVSDLRGNDLVRASQVYVHIPFYRLAYGYPDVDTVIVNKCCRNSTAPTSSTRRSWPTWKWEGNSTMT